MLFVVVFVDFFFITFVLNCLTVSKIHVHSVHVCTFLFWCAQFSKFNVHVCTPKKFYIVHSVHNFVHNFTHKKLIVHNSVHNSVHKKLIVHNFVHNFILLFVEYRFQQYNYYFLIRFISSFKLYYDTAYSISFIEKIKKLNK